MCEAGVDSSAGTVCSGTREVVGTWVSFVIWRHSSPVSTEGVHRCSHSRRRQINHIKTNNHVDIYVTLHGVKIGCGADSIGSGRLRISDPQFLAEKSSLGLIARRLQGVFTMGKKTCKPLSLTGDTNRGAAFKEPGTLKTGALYIGGRVQVDVQQLVSGLGVRVGGQPSLLIMAFSEDTGPKSFWAALWDPVVAVLSPDCRAIRKQCNPHLAKTKFQDPMRCAHGRGVAERCVKQRVHTFMRVMNYRCTQFWNRLCNCLWTFLGGHSIQQQFVSRTLILSPPRTAM